MYLYIGKSTDSDLNIQISLSTAAALSVRGQVRLYAISVNLVNLYFHFNIIPDELGNELCTAKLP